MQGGLKVYRGSAGAARQYVEADQGRADDYYLAEGTGLAERFVATPDGRVVSVGMLDGDAYETWVAGYDPTDGKPRGRLRSDEKAVRFVEVVVNGPKSWSLAAALHPEIAKAYDAAQDKATHEIIGWLAQHATTRVGPRGRQVQIPVDLLEAVTVRHYTSRAGDPHRHQHLQVNSRLFAAGQWRGLHTVGVRDSLAAINAIGHAAMMTDPVFRAALAGAGYTIDPTTGELPELAPFIGPFSERAAQIGRNIDRFEAQWRRANPGQEPGPKVRRSWDRRAWKDARPDKVIPADGADLVGHWIEQLHKLGYRDPAPQLPIVTGPQVGALNRTAAVETVLTRLAARRSAWNAADIRGEVERSIAATGLVAERRVRVELAEDLTARALEACVPLLAHPDVPEHVRALTSPHVLVVEADIVGRLAARSEPTTTAPTPLPARVDTLDGALDAAQREAVTALTSSARLVVVEGAAGAGKTTTLAATREALAEQDQKMLVLTPTRKAAGVAARELNKTRAGARTGQGVGSVAGLVYQHGFRWDADGRWTRVTADPTPGARLAPGDLLLVNEAGMLDQDITKALLTVADEMGARLALVGDRHQLPAVGRGGVLDLAARWVAPDAHVDLDVVHRFADPEYAELTLALRAGSPTYPVPGADDGPGGAPEQSGVPRDVFGALVQRGQVRVYATEAERTQALAETAAHAIACGRGEESLVIADTREQVAVLNGAIRDRLLAAGYLINAHSIVTGAGERIGVGDRVATRLNDTDLGVTNRATWTITGIGSDGSLTLRGHRATDLHTVPAGYARAHVELAYATTVYGAQGETTSTGHLVLGEHTSAASAYVGMTRGRDDNVVHLVADSLPEARAQWVEVMGRDRADLGPTVAARRAADDVERYGPQQQPARPLHDVVADLYAQWSQQADLTAHQHALLTLAHDLEQVAVIVDRYAPDRQRLSAAEQTATHRWQAARQAVANLDQTMATSRQDLSTRVCDAWRTDLHDARQAALVAAEGGGLLGQRRRQVTQAHEQLAEFATRWQPVVPEIPIDPQTLIGDLTCYGSPWLQDRHVAQALEGYAVGQVTAAYPRAERIRAVERTAQQHQHQVKDARLELENRFYEEAAQYRHATSLTDPHTHLTRITAELATVEDRLHRTQAQVANLEGEPAVRALPPGGLDATRRAWSVDRAQEQQDARAEARAAARERWRRQNEPQYRPSHPSPRPPDPGRGMGR